LRPATVNLTKPAEANTHCLALECAADVKAIIAADVGASGEVKGAQGALDVGSGAGGRLCLFWQWRKLPR
jgi:hypothetical protein